MSRATVTDVADGINQLAEINKQLLEKDQLLENLENKIESLEKSLPALELNKENLEKESLRIFNENKEAENRKKEQNEAALGNMDEERQKFENEKIAIAEEREIIAQERTDLERLKAEAEQTRIKHEEESATLESKVLESKRLSSTRADELKAIEDATTVLEEERKRTEIMRQETEARVEENRLLLEQIEAAKQWSQSIFDQITKERQQNEDAKRIAQSETEAATYIKNEAYRITLVFRQALNTFVQVNGTEIRIKEVDDEVRKFVMIDLLNQLEVLTIADVFTPEVLAEGYNASQTTPVLPVVDQHKETDISDLVGGTENQTPEDQEVKKDVVLEKMSKPELQKYALDVYKLELSTDDLTQKEMVKVIEDKAAEIKS
jgi:DNA repair exonuclease SbcCD ATPase subunit